MNLPFSPTHPWSRGNSWGDNNYKLSDQFEQFNARDLQRSLPPVSTNWSVYSGEKMALSQAALNSNPMFRLIFVGIWNFYRPRSEASEGYVFTGVCHSVTKWGGGGGQHQWSTTCPPPGPGQNIYPPRGPGQNIYPLPPRTRSEHLPPLPPGPGQNIYPPPPPETRSEHLPPPIYPPPPPPPETRSEHLPPPPLPTETTRRRAVRILLECILVVNTFIWSCRKSICSFVEGKLDSNLKRHQNKRAVYFR